MAPNTSTLFQGLCYFINIDNLKYNPDASPDKTLFSIIFLLIKKLAHIGTFYTNL